MSTFFARLPLATLWAISLLGAVQGCEEGPGTLQDDRALEAQVEVAGEESLDELVDRMVDAAFKVRFRGTRRVVLLDPGSEEAQPLRLEYLEHVGCDGAGQFAIETELLEASDQAAEDFEIGQRARQGFVFRQRDFAVRDREAFRDNYRAGVVGREMVAGVPCAVLDVERRDAPGPRYRIHVDPGTGLVLRSEQRDTQGIVCALVAFESFELGAELEDLHLGDHQLPRTIFDPARTSDAELARQMGFAVRLPEPPPGFQRLETARIESPTGRDWLKITYTDGLEILVLLQASLSEGEPPAWDLGVARIGGATLVNGTLARTSVIVIGRVGESLLLDWLDRAF